MQNESPRMRLARETAERQRLVDLAYSNLPPPPAGMKRVMWFGDSDTPMPVEVPESVLSEIEAISTQAGSGQGAIGGFPMQEQWKAKSKIDRLLQPYIDAQYPTLPRTGAVARSGSWWRRVLRKCGLKV